MPLPFSVATSTCGGSYQGILGIWIDLNQDGDFLDAGETQYMSSASFAYGTNVFVTGNIKHSLYCNSWYYTYACYFK
jgi:hypothetical protein